MPRRSARPILVRRCHPGGDLGSRVKPGLFKMLRTWLRGTGAAGAHHPGLDLYFIGLVQPIGAIMPIAEIQSERVADLLQGYTTLPPEPGMSREIAGYRMATSRRYVRSARHTIQMNFLPYLSEIRRERRVRSRRGLA